jgi:hypothetical protein
LWRIRTYLFEALPAGSLVPRAGNACRAGADRRRRSRDDDDIGCHDKLARPGVENSRLMFHYPTQARWLSRVT